jgi:hypothetical protein
MNVGGLHTNWDTILVGIPFLAMLMIGFFRLDEVFARPKSRVSAQRRPASGLDEDGLQILCDPDGQRWQSRQKPIR